MWVGSEEFIRQVQEKNGDTKYLIVLEEEETDSEIGIFRYQSCEKIYRSIFARCIKWGIYPQAGAKERRQRWLTITGKSSPGKLLAFSVVCAQLLARKERVLYVNLSACCGMPQLFGLEQDLDLSDLFLALRKEAEISVETFAGRLEETDYIFPVENPMILQEIEEKDMRKLLEVLGGARQYDRIVFALTDAVRGCELLLNASDRVLHVTEFGLLSECICAPWMHFLNQCREMEQKSAAEPVVVFDIPADSRGPHLISDWLEGPLGVLAEKILQEGGEDADTVAGDSCEPVWGDGLIP